MHVLIYSPVAGDHLDHAVREALALAAKNDMPVRFSFNGAEATVTKDTRPAEVLASLERQWDARHEAYKASPEGRAAAAAQAAQAARSQGRHDALMGNLPVAIRDEALLVQWLADYAGPADDTRVVGHDYESVAVMLESAGYIRADGLGLPREEYDNPAVLARWLIGQALDQLRSGMAPHPGMMERFAEDYRRASQARGAT